MNRTDGDTQEQTSFCFFFSDIPFAPFIASPPERSVPSDLSAEATGSVLTMTADLECGNPRSYAQKPGE